MLPRTSLPNYVGRLICRSSHFRQVSTKATLQYFRPLKDYLTVKPYYINVPEGGIPGHAETNEISDPYHNIPVHDLREVQTEVSLDKQGFIVARDDSADTKAALSSLANRSCDDEHLVMKEMASAMEQFLRRILHAETVKTFAFRIRRRDPEFPRLYRGTDGEVAQPVQGVHGDFTPDYARVTASYVGRSIDDLDLRSRRWQLISAWRPLFGPLYDWPLGLLDYTSMDCKRDLIASDNVYPHQVSETYNLFFSKCHRWFYLPAHQPNEVLLFKAFDSSMCPTVARVCPHAAFNDPSAPPNSRRRASFECVSLVLYQKGFAKQEHEGMLLSETANEFAPRGAFFF